MKELVMIALKNDQEEWKNVTKTNTVLCDDVFTNKRGTEHITINESATETPADLYTDFDVYAYFSEKEYNEVELAYLVNTAMETSVYSEKEPLILYYGTINNTKKPEIKAQVTMLTIDGSFIQTVECKEELTELDIIDLAAFKYTELETMHEKISSEQTKKYSK